MKLRIFTAPQRSRAAVSRSDIFKILRISVLNLNRDPLTKSIGPIEVHSDRRISNRFRIQKKRRSQ